MASSLISNSLHISFDSVFGMDDAGLVAVFESFVATGLKGFLGCPAVYYEDALTEFFENGLVRDGMIVSTIQGISIEISEEVFAAAFELPMEGLTDLSEVPKDLVFDVRSIFSESKEQGFRCGHSRTIFVDDCYHLWRANQLEQLGVRYSQRYGHTGFQASEGLRDSNLCYIEECTGLGAGDTATAEPVVCGTVEEESILGGTVVEQGPTAESIEERQNEPVVESTAEVLRTTSTDDVDFIIQQVITETAQLETDGGEHVVGSDVSRATAEDQAVGKADEVERWFDLPYEVLIAGDTEKMVTTASDTDEEFIVDQVFETEAVEQSADEAMSLEDILMTIPVECPLPSANVEVTKIILGKTISIPGVNEGDWYKASLPKIPTADKGKAPLLERDPVKGNPIKEQFSLIIADIEVLVMLREQIIDEARKINFTPVEGSSATDLKVMEMLSDLHFFVVEDLKEHTLAHGLKWEKTCCSKIFEGRPRDRGAIIVRTNTNTRSTCWIRTMIRVDGVWVNEPCADHWVTIPREVVIMRFCVNVRMWTLLPTVSEFFRVMRKRLADVLIRDVQIVQSSVSAIPSVQSSFASADRSFVQLLLDQRPQSPSTTSDSSMHFVEDDIQLEDDSAPDQYISTFSATAVSTSIDALRESFLNFVATQSKDSRQTNNALGEVLNKIDHVKRVFLDSIAEHNETFRDLFKRSSQEAQNDNNALSLALKAVRNQNVILSTDLEATRKELRDIKVAVSKDFDDKLADIRNELLEFRVDTKGQLASLSTHLAELIAFLTKGSDDKKGEDSSSSRPQPPPDNQSRPSRGTGGSGARDSGSRGGSQKRGDRSGSSKRRFVSSGGGPFRRSFED
ncbi:hypothetical protein F511_22616 [Dorcoceras hygrometricum]|uniref:Mucin-2-like n=1 Tax=Dorcoceras hygrometricum TaxID=472368 RepID=A0A2Z7CZV0_9LAMI|nr:hypothetical protein F511_22616 [Dorcoceras hygrometricum]